VKRSQYLAELSKRQGADNKIVCDDCGRASNVIHGIVDHDRNRVKVVCDDCYQGTYHEWLYGRSAKH
jgi:transcription elongation factor Elf1